MTTEHADIMHALAHDDPRALELIQARFHDLIVGQVLAVVGSTSLADDITHDVYVTIARHRYRVAEAKNLGGYLRVLARHEALQHVRRRPRDQPLPPPDLLEAVPGAEGGNEDAQVIAQALVQLPLPQREVIVLHVWQGLTFPAIAAQLGISANTVASRYRYACAKLRLLLEAHA